MLRLLLVLMALGMLGCASLSEKCVKFDIGEGGRVDLPNTNWFNANLGSAEGPVKMESCPLPEVAPLPASGA